MESSGESAAARRPIDDRPRAAQAPLVRLFAPPLWTNEAGFRNRKVRRADPPGTACLALISGFSSPPARVIGKRRTTSSTAGVSCHDQSPECQALKDSIRRPGKFRRSPAWDATSPLTFSSTGQSRQGPLSRGNRKITEEQACLRRLTHEVNSDWGYPGACPGACPMPAEAARRSERCRHD